MKKVLKEIKLLNRSIPGLVFSMLIISIVLMNILANKSIDLHSNYIALDCGIVFSWIVFMEMDLTVKRFGLKAANYLTIISLIINLFISLLLLIVSFIPGFWSMADGENAGIINVSLNLTFRNTWYVLLGSSIAFLVSGIVNNVINYLIGKRTDKKNNFGGFIIRSYISTFIGQFVDNFIFALLVSMPFFEWNIIQCITCALTGAVFELLFEVIFSPIGYRIIKKWEKENVGSLYLDYIKDEENESTNNRN